MTYCENDDMFLLDMLESAQQIQRYCRHRRVEELDSDPMLRDAVVRQLEVLGEAASRVSDRTRKDYSKIPWKQIVGMRNELIHAYHRVDHEIVWNTIQIELPALVSQLLEMQDEQ